VAYQALNDCKPSTGYEGDETLSNTFDQANEMAA
jgi:hypothetical protein